MLWTMVIDFHVHIWLRPMLPDGLLRAYLEPLLVLDGLMDMSEDRLNDWPMSQVKDEQLLEEMSAAGIDRSVVLPLDFGMAEKAKVGPEEYNDWVFERCALAGGKLVPFVGVDPQRGEEALRLVDKYVRRYDAKGVKIYPGTGFYADEERLLPFWDLVDDLGLIVTTHAGAAWGPLGEDFNRPSRFAQVLERHEGVRLVIAHMGGKFRAEMYELLARFPNAYTDISALQGWLPSNPEVAEKRLAEAAAAIEDRMLFGSDWPLFDLAFSHANWVRFVKERPWGTGAQKEKLLHGNAERLLR
jgi:predicted TIM-barrel fold metal-dependent hydrolase